MTGQNQVDQKTVNEFFAKRLKEVQTEAEQGSRAKLGNLEHSLAVAEGSTPRGKIDLGNIQGDFCSIWKLVEDKLNGFTWVPYVGKYIVAALALMQTVDEFFVNSFCATSTSTSSPSTGGTTNPATGGGGEIQHR